MPYAADFFPQIFADYNTYADRAERERGEIFYENLLHFINLLHQRVIMDYDDSTTNTQHPASKNFSTLDEFIHQVL